jgi:hypothetical protein
MSTPYSPQHCWMEWLVDVQVASCGCGSPVCLHTSWLGTADPEGRSPGRTCGYPDLDSHVPSPGTRHFWGGYKLPFPEGTLILRKIIGTYLGNICTKLPRADLFGLGLIGGGSKSKDLPRLALT